ncbi:Rhodanese domain-containing protein [Salinisphaera sp. T5B8]|uniref:rhodanese-like domain-containing protein n=1 Tax=Salinisphaera sp. T5B8 TaxID=1304154 RepID=UPI00333E5DC9
MTILDTLRRWLGRGGRSSAPRNADRARSDQTPVEVIDLEGAFEAHQAGARFIDVREPGEWAQGHIAGAVHHPIDGLEAQPQISVARDTPVVTYCAAGIRAARGAAALAASGYSDVKALDAGYGDWQAAGYPVEHPDNETHA